MFRFDDSPHPILQDTDTDLTLKDEVAGQQTQDASIAQPDSIPKMNQKDLHARVMRELKNSQDVLRLPPILSSVGKVQFQINTMKSLKRQLVDLPSRTPVEQRLIALVDETLRALISYQKRLQSAADEKQQIEPKKMDEKQMDKDGILDKKEKGPQKTDDKEKKKQKEG